MRGITSILCALLVAALPALRAWCEHVERTREGEAPACCCPCEAESCMPPARDGGPARTCTPDRCVPAMLARSVPTVRVWRNRAPEGDRVPEARRAPQRLIAARAARADGGPFGLSPRDSRTRRAMLVVRTL